MKRKCREASNLKTLMRFSSLFLIHDLQNTEIPQSLKDVCSDYFDAVVC